MRVCVPPHVAHLLVLRFLGTLALTGLQCAEVVQVALTTAVGELSAGAGRRVVVVAGMTSATRPHHLGLLADV